MTTQVLEALRAEARMAEQAHMDALAAAKAGEAQLWQQRLQHAEAASQQQVWQKAPLQHTSRSQADKDDCGDNARLHRPPGNHVSVAGMPPKDMQALHGTGKTSAAEEGKCAGGRDAG